MPALRTTTESHERGTVIALLGDIDLATADRFYEDVMTVARTPGTRVVLDCEQLAFIDSSGLRALIQCHKACRELESRIVLAAPTPRVAKILHVTAIDSRVPVYPSVEAALNDHG